LAENQAGTDWMAGDFSAELPERKGKTETLPYRLRRHAVAYLHSTRFKAVVQFRSDAWSDVTTAGGVVEGNPSLMRGFEFDLIADRGGEGRGPVEDED